MKNRLYHLICTLLIIISLISCTNSDLHNDIKLGKYQSTLKFKVAQSVRNINTEDEIKRLDIFLFKDDVLEKTILNITSFNTTADGYGNIILDCEDEGVRKVLVVANIDNPTPIENLKPGITTIQEMQGIRTSSLTKMSNPPLLMYGISDDISFSNISNTSFLKLYRVVARIDVVNVADNFVLTNARLVNSRDASIIFPGDVPSDIAVKDFEWINAVDSKVSLFTYENLQLSDSSSTSIEIKGAVNGIPLTYNVKLMNEAENFPIQRNSQYNVNVNNVQQNNVIVNISVHPWLTGNDINETVEGTLPVIVANIDRLVGTYDIGKKWIDATVIGGNVIFETEANAECGVEIADSWIKIVPNSKASTINTQFSVDIEPNDLFTPRTTTIRFFNKINDKSQIITITQAKAEVQEEKYMVLVVAGQSNAVGYDESAVFPAGIHKPNPRAFQLSYRYGSINPSITLLTWCSENLQDMSVVPNAKGGTKGIHLPLANELLNRIPSDYKLLIIPVAYGGTSLLSATNQSMLYDAEKMQPSVMNAPLQWGVGRPYNRTMIDRVKDILGKNQKNKFLGVVWCQGENDATKSELHYAAFNQIAQDFFSKINAAGFGPRCPKGVADKDIWYNFSSTKYWSDWYLTASNSAPVFGGYKVWNPNTFIHVPFNTETNEVNGNGATSSNRASHFGNDSYINVIAPMVAECMDNNGGLFNGKTAKNDRFIEKDIRVNANILGGSLNDNDLKNELKAFYQLNGSYNALTTVGFSLRPTVGASFVNSSGLIDITGNQRNQSVFNVSATSRLRLSGTSNTGDWTIAFMFKRTGGYSNAIQTIVPATATSPFIGFKKYTNNGGAGTYAEFVVEPIAGSDPLKAVAGQFMDADNVRTQEDWIHYVVTYSVVDKMFTIYMNGQMVGQKSISTAPSLDMSTVDIGVASGGVIGEMCNFGLWYNVLTHVSVKKLYLHSYYGFTK